MKNKTKKISNKAKLPASSEIKERKIIDYKCKAQFCMDDSGLPCSFCGMSGKIYEDEIEL